MSDRQQVGLAKSQMKAKFTFLVLGFASLTSYSTILAELFFLQHFLKNHNPAKIFTTLTNFFNLSLLLSFQAFGPYISYTKQLILFQLISVIILAAFPFVTIYLEESISYVICCIFFALSGISGSLANSSIFAVVSFFHEDIVGITSVGQGLGGILSNVLNFIILFLFGGDSEKDLIKSAYFYFEISAGIMLFSLILTISLFRNEFFLRVAIKNGIVKGVDDSVNNKEVELIDEEKPQKSEETFSLISLIKKLFVTNTLMALNYIGTFIVFPGSLLAPKLFDLQPGIKVNTILLIFNLFDTLGRKLADYPAKNIRNIVITVFGRLAIIGIIVFNLYANEMGTYGENLVNALTLINPALLGLTNGLGTTLIFVTAPSLVEEKWKGRAGTSISLFLTIGIFLGSLASIPFQNLTSFRK